MSPFFTADAEIAIRELAHDLPGIGGPRAAAHDQHGQQHCHHQHGATTERDQQEGRLCLALQRLGAGDQVLGDPVQDLHHQVDACGRDLEPVGAFGAAQIAGEAAIQDEPADTQDLVRVAPPHGVLMGVDQRLRRLGGEEPQIDALLGNGARIVLMLVGGEAPRGDRGRADGALLTGGPLGERIAHIGIDPARDADVGAVARNRRDEIEELGDGRGVIGDALRLRDALPVDGVTHLIEPTERGKGLAELGLEGRAEALGLEGGEQRAQLPPGRVREPPLLEQRIAPLGAPAAEKDGGSPPLPLQLMDDIAARDGQLDQLDQSGQLAADFPAVDHLGAGKPQQGQHRQGQE